MLLIRTAKHGNNHEKSCSVQQKQLQRLGIENLAVLEG